MSACLMQEAWDLKFLIIMILNLYLALKIQRLTKMKLNLQMNQNLKMFIKENTLHLFKSISKKIKTSNIWQLMKEVNLNRDLFKIN
jgi:hypothetical protein